MFVSTCSMVEMMDIQPKNEQAFTKQRIAFHHIEKSLAVKSLRKEFKTVLKQSVIQNLPLFIDELADELPKDNLNKSEKKMKINKLNKAIGYLRTATSTEDNEKNSLFNQKQEILSWAKENDIKIEKFYSDVGSGFRGELPLQELMIEEVEKHIVSPDALIVSSSSRISRNLETTLQLKNFLKNRRIEFISVNEILSTPFGTAFSLEYFIGMINEQQSKMNSKYVHNRLNDNARNGYFTGGIIPFGYETAPVKNNERRKELIRNPCESVIVEEIFRLATSGLYGTPFKIKEVSNYLNKKNSKYRGKRWTARFVSSILKNTLYYGERVWGKSRGLSYKNVDPIVTKNQPIISKQMFLKVQKNWPNQSKFKE